MSPENRNPEFDLPEEILALPLVCQEDLLVVLDFLQERKPAKRMTLGELERQMPSIRQHAQKVFDGLRPFKTNTNSWHDAMGQALGTAIEVVKRDPERKRITDHVITGYARLVHDRISGVVHQSLKSTKNINFFFGKEAESFLMGYFGEETIDDEVRAKGTAIYWAAAKDKLGENSFYHLFKIQQLAQYKIYWIEEGERFIVLIPARSRWGCIVGKNTTVCLSFGGSGQEVAHIHDPKYDLTCLNNQSHEQTKIAFP